MKKIITLFLLFVTGISHGLDGYSQVRMEKVYDSYRARFIDGKTTEEQTAKIQKIQQILATYKNNKKISATTKAMYAYLEHLFCEAESIIDGVVCQDKYTTPGVLTDDISTRKLSETRKILIKEHSARRVQRGLGGLKESDILNTIAQNYANILCAAGYITHEFNGSKLEERYDAGGYVYDFGGENLGSGQLTVAQILDQLTTSIHHRENMYEPDFTEIGVGQCKDIWVLNYGTPTKA